MENIQLGTPRREFSRRERSEKEREERKKRRWKMVSSEGTP